MPSHGKKLTFLFATLAVVVLGVAGWIGWPWLQFYWRFESLGLNDQGSPEYRHRQTGIIMVRVPGGTFWMGAQKDDPEGRNYDPEAVGNEGPVHEVTLSPFLIGKYEVTQAEWQAVMGNYPSQFDGTRDALENPVSPPHDRARLPVEQVNWDDIQEFETKTGLGLPTEAQWEFACRGGTGTAFSFGSGQSCLDWECAACPERDAYMWYCGNSGGSTNGRTYEIGAKAGNPFGLHDMHGNVYEWCEDVWDPMFYSNPEAEVPDPLCTSGSDRRVRRGGSWADYAWFCRAARRNWLGPDYSHGLLGFRVAAPCP